MSKKTAIQTLLIFLIFIISVSFYLKYFNDNRKALKNKVLEKKTNINQNSSSTYIDNIDYIHGDADAIGDATFDIILANINRNIILQDIEKYVGAMNEKSEIIFSGFLKEDIPLILEKSEQLGLDLVVSKNKNKWQMLHLKKV